MCSRVSVQVLLTRLNLKTTPALLLPPTVVVPYRLFFRSRITLGGDFWVIRTNDGLQYVPNPYSVSDDDVSLLDSILVSQ